jgi:hypothetical protein
MNNVQVISYISLIYLYACRQILFADLIVVITAHVRSFISILQHYFKLS